MLLQTPCSPCIQATPETPGPHNSQRTSRLPHSTTHPHGGRKTFLCTRVARVKKKNRMTTFLKDRITFIVVHKTKGEKRGLQRKTKQFNKHKEKEQKTSGNFGLHHKVDNITECIGSLWKASLWTPSCNVKSITAKVLLVIRALDTVA